MYKALTISTPRLPASELIPPIETECFKDKSEAGFYIASLTEMGNGHASNILQGAMRLRANVYIDECSFLPSSARRSDGTECDEYDARSQHFIAIENHSKGSRVVGNLRGIVKNCFDQPLPAERYFPESFEENAAPLNSIEASRFIARHEDKVAQSAVSLGLIRAIVLSALSTEQEPIYAVVEKPLARLFVRVGLPLEKISPTKQLEEYNNTDNMLLRFSAKEIVRTVDEDSSQEKYMTNYLSVRKNNGIGFYDQKLLKEC